MRFSVLAFTAIFAAAASAQDFGDIPTCALPCFAAAVPASGCSLTDSKCQCTTGKDKITKAVTDCVPSKCGPDDITKLASAVTKLCANAGVTVSDLPTAAPSGSSAKASATKSVASAASSAASSATSAAAEHTGAAVANGAAFGAVALGFAAAML